MIEECFWGDKTYKPHKPLSMEHKTRYLIVGGGVSGLFTAYYLLENGVTDITVIEEKVIGSGSTGRSAGMLTCENETAHWSDFYKEYGEKRTQLFYEAQKKALNDVSKLLNTEDIPCDFALRDYYVVAGGTAERKKLLSEFRIVKKLGSDADLLEGEALKKELNTPIYDVGERREQGISVDPMRFIQGVGKYLSGRGVHIFENTILESVDDSIAHTSGGEVHFSHIIYTQGPSQSGENLANYITTIGITHPLPEATLSYLKLADKDMFADMVEPSFFYAKVTGDNRLMIGYGDDVFDSNSAEVPLYRPHLVELWQYLKNFLNGNEEITFEYAWSGVFSLSKETLPQVSFDGTSATIAGAGSQIASIALAEYIATKFVTDSHSLDTLFEHDPEIYTEEE